MESKLMLDSVPAISTAWGARGRDGVRLRENTTLRRATNSILHDRLTDSSTSSEYGPSALMGAASLLNGMVGEINGGIGDTNAELTAIWPLIEVVVLVFVDDAASSCGTIIGSMTMEEDSVMVKGIVG